MANLQARDKQLLGDAGLALSDTEYVEAVAGFGLAGSTGFRDADFVGFDFSRDRWVRPPVWSIQQLQTFSRSWHILQETKPFPRVVVSRDPREIDEPDVLSLFRILTRPEARTSSVFLKGRLPQVDLRWQLPIRVGAWQDDYDALGLLGIASKYPASAMMQFRALSRQHARCEVLVLRGTVRTALQRILAAPFAVRAALVLIIGPTDTPWRRMETSAEALLAETQAGGLSLASPESLASFEQAFRHWARELSHNTRLDVSLQTAFQGMAALHLLTRELIEATALPTAAQILGRRLGALPRTVAFNLPQETLNRIRFAPNMSDPASLGRELLIRANVLPFDRESEGGSALAEIAVAEQRARESVTGAEQDRVLQAEVFATRDGKAVKHTGSFVVEQPHRVEVFIGPRESGTLAADEAFPDKKLDWQNADQFTLGVIFSEPNQWDAPQTGELILGRYGSSDRCRFDFAPTKLGPFRARLTIHYRGRILQTALLEGTVVVEASPGTETPTRLSVETQIRGNLTTLDDRRRFDASLLLNTTITHERTLQAAGQEGAYIASLDNVTQQMETISAHLHDVANDAKRYRKGGLMGADCAEMLVKLATEGRELYGSLVVDYIDRSAAAAALRDSEYLQIVATKADAKVPLELAYEYAAPADGAPVCPNAKVALANGHCPADCVPQSAPAPHVCPMGFWGLRKVIERHVHDAEIGTEARVDALEPIAGRDVMLLSGPALLAASQNVPSPAQQELATAIRKEWEVSGPVTVVKKWEEWKTTISAEKPRLVLALPHSSGAGTNLALEISGDTLASRYIDKNYLGVSPNAPPPLFVLMGCDVAGAGDAKAYTSHVAQFRRQGATVILGTLATIDGRDAATAAGILVEHLVEIVSRAPARFGEVVRAAKREAMSKGLLMVLGLVGFGDADWQLKFKERDP